MTDHIVARSAELEWREVEGEIVLLDQRTQRYLSLNRTGGVLWPLMVAGTDRARLVQVLVERHDVTLEVATRDVDALIGQLSEADLLEPSESDASPQRS
jgi:hypothetical protein